MSEVTPELFEEVAKIMSDPNIPPKKKSSMDEKLRVYALYKCATVGRLHPPYTDDDTDTDKRPKSRPGMLSWEARSKYDAWANIEGVANRADARKKYVAFAEGLVGDPVSDCIKEHSS
uniref:ACB domain-containing protein n=1 Tax=Odontella aurita TaxID=265563 RepID=A0A7S4IME8_9STRA|mmetsp:Transcript_2737/g.7172  ORF Transcript_2737/g.7172 Transcript_2737/m.7172 type:complete len:118 (+) Transcript_2737:185-538(+)|eukprot:CAMPEP_0113545056 /NCGR_PEP_ID=MMETSP0015_2-20120614/11048_1 /TAXON_ID=2838 /ORGANISM="Odontella" /LENGTH=117 /DNA_ID=CAMNT_0000445377 /DNA_START=140 /DNA_END=493 /DNA_ORIENTATION=+ /assembly_acc=CAM_ASM_000160